MQSAAPGVAHVSRRFSLPVPRTVLRDHNIVIACVALFVTLSIASPEFLTKSNLLNILYINAPVAIVACGATIVIIGGAFDLSAGAMYALAGVVAAWGAVHVGSGAGIAAGILAGAVLGLINGVLVEGLRVNSFLATLSTHLAFGGIATAITGGFLITVGALSFGKLGADASLGVDNAVWIFAAAALILGFLLARTKFGRYVYAIGGNEEAARLSGVPVHRVRIQTFVIAGLCAALAGVIAASKDGGGSAQVDLLVALNAISAVVLGGTRIEGGVGAMWRTVLGVLLLAMITNGFNLLQLQPFYQDVCRGAIIVGAVALNSFASGRRA